MKRNIILILVLSLILLSGCAALNNPPAGFDQIGHYNKGQFDPDRNQGFVKLYTPEPEDRIPDFKISMYPNCVNWIKRCEWHCMDVEGY